MVAPGFIMSPMPLKFKNLWLLESKFLRKWFNPPLFLRTQ